MIATLVALAVVGAIGFALWNGLSSAIRPADGTSIDAARIVRSAAIAFGMYLAMLAVTVGIIDLLQAIVGGDRLAGSNSDLARALSLLIVGTPVFALLVRLVDGDRRAALGWSVHLVAALTTTLIGVLTSSGQLIEDFRDVERAEVAQLVGWLMVWAAYWFVLRPRLGVQGHVHLLIGATLGLVWLVGGVVGLGAETGSRAYAELFAEPIVGGVDLLQWLLVAVVGGLTWWWHWRALDRNDERGVEDLPRQSSAWFAMVVAVGIVPAVIALLTVLGGALAGTLIWLVGSPRQSAVDWFDDAPAAIVVGCVALAVWAFHRWLLLRDGEPARNESLRFHDYSVLAVGLVAVVSGIALLVSLVLDAVTVDSLIASSFDLDNQLIGSLVLLGLGSGLWWFIWARIEQHRLADAVGESDSIWRKLYLTIAAGLGGLILAVCLIWILFATLRDLFDGELGGSTLDALSAPVGWTLAVLAGVWFHIGVWRSDRFVLHRNAAGTPASQPSVTQTPLAVPAFRWATEADDGELFTLQRAAFVDEAMAYETPQVPTLTETFDGFQARTRQIRTLVAVDGTRIVGAVGVRTDGAVPSLERLMVAPDRRHQQLGRALVTGIVGHVKTDGHDQVRAIVGDRNPDLLRFYDGLGFALVGRTEATADIPELLVLERPTTLN